MKHWANRVHYRPCPPREGPLAKPHGATATRVPEHLPACQPMERRHRDWHQRFKNFWSRTRTFFAHSNGTFLLTAGSTLPALRYFNTYSSRYPGTSALKCRFSIRTPKSKCQRLHLKAESGRNRSVVQRWKPTHGLERFAAAPSLAVSWHTIEVMAGMQIVTAIDDERLASRHPGATFSFFAGDLDLPAAGGCG